MTIIQLGIFVVCVVLMAVQFKSLKPEYGIYMTIAAALVIFFYSLSKIQVIFESINTLKKYVNLGGYMPVIIKIVGISYISEFASDICKDSGYGTIGNQIQIFGKLSILAVSMPVFEALFKTIDGLIS
ncbi:MAG: stage III sporulation protein AD [Lachnospiraceae bacterium]|nr:stage III sporulation protein AD [Lachnospiraceae bacterium]